MQDVVIRVEHLSKRYRLGQVGTGTLVHDLNRWWHLVRGKDDPFAKIGSLKSGGRNGDLWALRDVSFDVHRGEVLGIIGRNGAGKSSLLKILSRVTSPTSGQVKVKGRIVSLLEVGTGFHPELTGRENIFLNGAILGMSRAEVRQKLDEIVAFAEVEQFLDTPVKRYSSGMYVRLAFAVAAHLEPEILIVDEVLAVGDAEFQKKCLGKMKDVAGGGRTVLFVSHNMAAITALTSHCILLSRGTLLGSGLTKDITRQYLESRPGGTFAAESFHGAGKYSRICRVEARQAPELAAPANPAATPVMVTVDLEKERMAGMSLELFLLDPNGNRLGIWSLFQHHNETLPSPAGGYRVEIPLAGLPLAEGTYGLDVHTSVANHGWDHQVPSAVEIDIPLSNPGPRGWSHQFTMGFGSMSLESFRRPGVSAIHPPAFSTAGHASTL